MCRWEEASCMSEKDERHISGADWGVLDVFILGSKISAVLTCEQLHLRLRVSHEREGDTLGTSHIATAKRLMPISMT
jgi:hypothetical protein